MAAGVPQRAVWIPAGVTHQVRMLGSARAAPSRRGRAACEVVEVSPLLRQLLLAAVDMPAQYDREGRDGALARLLLHEVPRDARLGRCARPSWRRRTSARGRRTGPGGCT